MRADQHAVIETMNDAHKAQERIKDMEDSLRALIEKWRGRNTPNYLESEIGAALVSGTDAGYSGAADDLEALLEQQ
jgi:hypothetical protein